MTGTTQAVINSFFAKRTPKEPEKIAADGETKLKVKKRKIEDSEEEADESAKAQIGVKELEQEVNNQALSANGLPGNNSSIPPIKETNIAYKTLADVFEKCEATTKRLEINKYCGDMFLEVLNSNPELLPKVVYLFINRLGPEYEGLELGLGESLIIKALSEATGRSLAQVKADYVETGDLGMVAVKSRSSQPTMFKPKDLEVASVFKSLTEIAKTTGNSSQSKKIGIIKRLLTACRGTEAKYLVRSLEGKLRIGVQERSVIIGLSQAFVQWEAQKKGKMHSSDAITKAEAMLSEAHCQLPNYEVIIRAVIDHGIQELDQHCKLVPGIPLKPMLAKPTKSITEVLDRFSGEKFTSEYKYDGERTQVHCTSDGKFKVFSRNLEDMSQRYPDILSAGPKLVAARGVKDFVMDCEAVAWDREKQKILPFQILSTRKRKDVEENSIVVRVRLFAFDLLYLNGEPLLKKSLEERRAILRDHFDEIPDELAFAKHMNSDDIEEIQTFLDQSMKDGCEGLMVKALDKDSEYEPSKRSRNWLKLKKDYLEGVGDSLDLVVLGAYFGRGKRTGVYGGYLLGSYNPENEEYETICKIGTGFSEEDLEKLHSLLKDTVLDHKKSYVSHDTAGPNQPDVWFEPKAVFEVLTADLSLSPIYRAGINELGKEKGISLRFPRFIRLREDKAPEDATSSERVVEFYKKQVGV